GCLPLLLQFPVFASLFQVLRNPQEYLPTSSELYHQLCNGFGDACGDTVTKALHLQYPAFEVGSKLINHLDKFMGIWDLSVHAPAPTGVFPAGPPSSSLVVWVMFPGYVQPRQAQKRTPQVNKQMGAVMKFLPVIFGFISLNMPAGLVLYFLVSNLWRLGQ